MNKLVIPAGHEIRVELIRLYPSAEDHAKIRQLQIEVRAVTNHIIRGRADVSKARYAYAKRNGLILKEMPLEIPRPCPPMPVTEEDRESVTRVWKEYRTAKKSQAVLWAKWYQEIRDVLPDIPELAWRKDTYQHLRKIYGKLSNATLLRDVVKRVAKIKGAKVKQDKDHIPLVWANAAYVVVGDHYGIRNRVSYYNALVKVNGMQILGRLRRPLPGTVVQGLALKKFADGWYAVVKCIVPKRVLPDAGRGVIAIDVGQTDIVATIDTDHKTASKPNHRTVAWRSVIDALQSVSDLSGDTEGREKTRRKVARMHLRAKRQIDHWLNAEFLPKLATYSHVVIERLSKGFYAKRGALSCMHHVLSAVKVRLGHRVLEVEAPNTSRTCSICQHCAKDQRSAKKFTCRNPLCGYTDDADLNAARNILAKGIELLAA